MNDRCRQTHQSGPAGGGDGWRRDDQDHLGVHQREGDKVMGGGVNTHWCESHRNEVPALSDLPIFIFQTDTWMCGWGMGGMRKIICLRCGGGTSVMFHLLTG